MLWPSSSLRKLIATQTTHQQHLIFLVLAQANREVPIPEHIDIWFLCEEAQPSDVTALQAVIDTAAGEVTRLEVLAEKLVEELGQFCLVF